MDRRLSARLVVTALAGLVSAALLLGGCASAATPTEPAGAEPTAAAVDPGIRETERPSATAVSPEVTETSAPAESAVLVEKRQIVLEWPERIREKDSDVIVLSLVVDPEGRVTVSPESPGSTVEGTPVDVPDAYDTHNVVAVARLDIAGLDSWREEVREPMRRGQTVTFRWSIRPQETGVYRGVVWLYLDFVPKEGGNVEQVTLLSRPIQVEAVSVMGLPGWAARSLGGAGMVVSTVLAFPFLQPAAEWLWKRRRAKKG